MPTSLRTLPTSLPLSRSDSTLARLAFFRCRIVVSRIGVKTYQPLALGVAPVLSPWAAIDPTSLSIIHRS